MGARWMTMDGNEAVARVAHALSEVIAIYPITPSSAMGELADAWSAAGRTNLWGAVPEVIEMQSEAGAAGALHGALQEGALATTFTSSQGLLLMIPNMYKIAGELTPAVIHVAARAVATHALSIFGDHSDVMSTRMTGFAMLASSSVQEAHDLALVAHAATLRSRVPFVHFFDGFRTSHEVSKIQLLDDADLIALIDDEAVLAHRLRGLSPNRPVLRGSAQNPDVFFQAREAVNPFYEAVPGIVASVMEELGARTGRPYRLVDYVGAPDAQRVVVLMGSATGAARETVQALCDRGEKVGAAVIRLFRPFPSAALLSSLPPTVAAIAVLDRTKEPGSVGEPLYLDVVAAFNEAAQAVNPGTAPLPTIIGARYGLASKELTPAMLKGVFDELSLAAPRRHVTVGIVDDVTRTSVTIDRTFVTEPAGRRAVFYGLASDGTVGATKSSVKIIGEQADRFAQAYFVYDSKKAGTVTVSHLRFGPEPIESTYLVTEADFVACHQFSFLERTDVLSLARRGATVLLNSPYAAERVWEHLPVEVQQTILDKDLDVWVVDAYDLARELGLGRRINIIMQTCFFELAGILPREQAAERIKQSVEREYAKRGRVVVEQNWAAVDRALGALHRAKVPDTVTAVTHRRPPVPAEAPDFVQRVTARLLAGEGDLLPVSALPIDGTFPTGTTRWEKRDLATEIPIWDPSICIDCGKCTIVCPHSAIRMKVFEPETVSDAPAAFLSKSFRSRELPNHLLTVQVAPDDCTGCGVCVEACPAHSKTDPSHRSINMVPADEHRTRERANWEFFLAIPELDRSLIAHDSVKGSQLLEPLFEFSGACSGCGETPYLKLLTQLFGDRMIIANATGCSSIYGGNLPTAPWCSNADGRGPAWNNSLFEDNAEFGLGMRVALDRQEAAARALLAGLRAEVGTETGTEMGPELVEEILGADQSSEAGIHAQRARVQALIERLERLGGVASARHLATLAPQLVRHSVWIVGGDGWAYDIGFGGLDHVLASGRNVNVLVLDTEVYSNTGGQASKATQRGAVARFATAGKATPKKDLGLVAMSYGNVYVAQIALGGSDIQTVKALLEADAWPGPSLVIAYSSCVPAHGFEESQSMVHQRDAVHSGYWPLYRYRPDRAGEPLFKLDSHPPSMPLREFALSETRFATMAERDPARSEELLALAQDDVNERWHFYEQLAALERTPPGHDGNEREGGSAT